LIEKQPLALHAPATNYPGHQDEASATATSVCF
jgi:hypothetical protein